MLWYATGKAPVPLDRVAEIVRLTQQPPPFEATHWTLRAMARAAGIAASTVQAIWKAHGLSPHRWRNAIDSVRTLRQCAADWRGRWTIKTQRGSRVLVATVTG